MNSEAHKARMKDRRERQLARETGFTPVPRQAKLNLAAALPKPAQVTIVNEDHYLTLHPTRGWQRISNKRVYAQHIAERLLGRAAV